ncbi:MAG: hypothetical protein ACJ71J_15695 [Nitrososphaeraceae archaeon]|jgi:hypothetical protein
MIVKAVKAVKAIVYADLSLNKIRGNAIAFSPFFPIDNMPSIGSLVVEDSEKLNL